MVGTTNTVTIVGLHFSLTDKAKWVEPGATCDGTDDADAAGGSTAVDTWFDFQTPALNRNFASDQHSRAVFSFSRPGVRWQLCFKFATERCVLQRVPVVVSFHQALTGQQRRYHKFEDVTITGVKPVVASVSHSTHVVNVPKQFELQGTVGVSVMERIKVGRRLPALPIVAPCHLTFASAPLRRVASLQWVHNVAADCEGPGVSVSGASVDADDNSIVMTAPTNPAVVAGLTDDVEALSVTGTASATFAFASSSPDFLPWRLCYKFGDAPYHMFSSVTMAAKTLTSVRVTTSASGSGILIDEPAVMVFSGQGIKDGDRAKVRCVCRSGVSPPHRFGVPPLTCLTPLVRTVDRGVLCTGL